MLLLHIELHDTVLQYFFFIVTKYSFIENYFAIEFHKKAVLICNGFRNFKFNRTVCENQTFLSSK